MYPFLATNHLVSACLASRNAENTLTGMWPYHEEFGQVREKGEPYLWKKILEMNLQPSTLHYSFAVYKILPSQFGIQSLRSHLRNLLLLSPRQPPNEVPEALWEASL